ncbi:MAG: DnaJ family domain-containing protein [Desulfohalobiaceae bacterium]
MSKELIALQQIAETKIRQAQREGELDNLPGEGQRLELDDDSHIPSELRMAYRILKNADYVSPEVQQRKEIADIKEMLQDCQDERTLYQKVQKLNLYITKLNEQRRTPIHLQEEQVYYQKVLERVRVAQKNSSDKEEE